MAGEVFQQDIYNIVGESFLDYALSVITDRALPNIIDGLKPIQRKVLYSMYLNNLTPSANFHKCATTVGHTIGLLSPHGDSSTYEALVNMAQPFSMRYPLVDFNGNVGSIDGDPPAAYRYTESKLSSLGYAMLENLDKNTVQFQPNFDNTTTEPIVLSGYICNSLLNGCTGIAVGMACSLVPHNLNEVYDALIYYIDQTIANKEIVESEVFKIIKGPDFPLGGTIVGTKGIKDYMRTGTGSIPVRANYKEVHKSDKHQIIFTDLPYKVNKAELVKTIDDMKNNGFFNEIKEIRDESNKDEIVRIVIDLKKDANINILLNKLYRKTKLQTNISVNNTVLIGTQPVVVNLDYMIQTFLSHSVDVSANHIQYERDKINVRLNVVNGFIKAADNIDIIVNTIKTSNNDFEDLKALNIFDNDEQIKAVLDMQFKNISNLNKKRYIEEQKTISSKIAEYDTLLTDESALLTYIKNKYIAIKKKFGDERRTSIIEDEYKQIDDEDLIEEKMLVISYSNNDIVKAVLDTEYKTQNRKGKGVTQNVNEEENDSIKKIITVNNKDEIFFFTNTGRCHIVKAYHINLSSKNGKGKHINNYIKLNEDEQVVNMIAADAANIDNSFIFVTERGIIKKMSFSLLPKKTSVTKVATLIEGDTLAGVDIINESSKVIMITENGKALSIDSDKLRSTGKLSKGVKGMNVANDDKIVKVIVSDKENDDNNYLLTVTKNGYVKQTKVSLFNTKSRGGKGVAVHKINNTTGYIADAAIITKSIKEILVSTKNGKMLRTSLTEIKSAGRVSSGVILIKLDELDNVASVSIIDEEADKEQQVTE